MKILHSWFPLIAVHGHCTTGLRAEEAKAAPELSTEVGKNDLQFAKK